MKEERASNLVDRFAETSERFLSDQSNCQDFSDLMDVILELTSPLLAERFPQLQTALNLLILSAPKNHIGLHKGKHDSRCYSNMQ